MKHWTKEEVENFLRNVLRDNFDSLPSEIIPINGRQLHLLRREDLIELYGWLNGILIWNAMAKLDLTTQEHQMDTPTSQNLQKRVISSAVNAYSLLSLQNKRTQRRTLSVEDSLRGRRSSTISSIFLTTSHFTLNDQTFLVSLPLRLSFFFFVIAVVEASCGTNASASAPHELSCASVAVFVSKKREQVEQRNFSALIWGFEVEGEV